MFSSLPQRASPLWGHVSPYVLPHCLNGIPGSLSESRGYWGHPVLFNLGSGLGQSGAGYIPSAIVVQSAARISTAWWRSAGMHLVLVIYLLLYAGWGGVEEEVSKQRIPLFLPLYCPFSLTIHWNRTWTCNQWITIPVLYQLTLSSPLVGGLPNCQYLCFWTVLCREQNCMHTFF